MVARNRPILVDAPPVNGVLKFFTGLDESLMEQLQGAFPEARFVKAFNSVGKENCDPVWSKNLSASGEEFEY